MSRLIIRKTKMVEKDDFMAIEIQMSWTQVLKFDTVAA